MIIDIKKSDHTDVSLLATDKEITRRLIKDFIFFGGMRGLTSAFYFETFLSYTQRNIENLDTSADLNILLAVANMMRELLSPVSNSITDALDAKDVEKLQDLHRVAIMSGINPALITWAFNQFFVLLLPYMGRTTNQLWIVPTTTFPATCALMALTSEYNYGSIRNPIPSLSLLLASGPILLLSNYALSYIDTTATYLILASGVQCVFFVLGSIVYLEWKYPTEHFVTSLFAFSKWKQSYIEAGKINILGIQPALILLSEVVSGILVNKLLNQNSLAAYQLMASVVIGLGGVFSQTFQQRIQNQMRHILNKLEDYPILLRKALRKLLLHATWLSIIIPITTGCAAVATGELFVDLLYKKTPDKMDIINEATGNVSLVFVLLTLRFIAAVFSGMIFAVRNSSESYHQWLNKYSSIVRILNPLVFVAIGIILDYVYNLGSTGYWIGGIIALAISNAINFSFVWKLIEYEYNKDTTQPRNTPEQKTSYCPTFWRKSDQTPVDYIPMKTITVETQDELLEDSISEPETHYSFFQKSQNYIAEKKALIEHYFV